MTMTQVDKTYKLGKLPVQTDVRTLRLARYVDRSALPTPPSSIDLARPVHDWPMYANDRIGDCTCAAAGHMIEAWTAASSGKAVEVTEKAVLDAFNHVKTVDPTTGEEGANELDVLKYWRKEGIGGHTIGAFAAISVDDRQLLETGAYLFGGLYIGIELPITAQDQQEWNWTGKLQGPAAPGSWGGHAVDVVGYAKDRLTVVTWGALKEMTWSFWEYYCDEAYCLISADFLEAGKSPEGFDLKRLKEDLRLVTATGTAT